MKAIELMYQLYGKSNEKCKDCCNLVTYNYGNKKIKKCKIYGLTSNCNSDWAYSYNSCGLFNQDTNLRVSLKQKKLHKDKKNKEEILKGQLTLK